ncbi:MAG: hypothetical protein EOP04_01750 [Proteobacteria bacterium]|nr:MAG: hypothetical protein EOP04_01750 [Pseudomonadota bacterium]
MNNWKQLQIESKDLAAFNTALNQCIVRNHDKAYYKIFTPKDKNLKFRVFFIADEGSPVVEALGKLYSLNACTAPKRSEITRVAGFTVERNWMFND